MAQDTIGTMQKRGQRYWFEDGLWELVIGSAFVVFAIYYGIVGSLETGSTLNTILSVGYVVVIPGVMILSSRIMRSLKARITAPRTGFVSFHRSKRRIARSIVVGVVVGGASAAGAIFIDAINTPVLLGGLAMAFVIGITGYRVGVRRIYVAAITILVSAIALSLTVADTEAGFALLFAIGGLVVAITGGITFVRYLHRNPVRDEEHGDSTDGEERQA